MADNAAPIHNLKRSYARAPRIVIGLLAAIPVGIAALITLLVLAAPDDGLHIGPHDRGVFVRVMGPGWLRSMRSFPYGFRGWRSNPHGRLEYGCSLRVGDRVLFVGFSTSGGEPQVQGAR